MSEYLFPFMLTVFAGLSTGIGGLLAFHKKAANAKFLSFALGFSAGVMLYVSFIEIFPKSYESLTEIYGDTQAYFLTTVAFFVGVFLIAVIDKLVPEGANPHEIHDIEETEEEKKAASLLRMGLFSALAIAIHNFPEGLATFVAALDDPTLGIGIAIAIAIHNIPEGIAVAIPIFHATGSKKKAFFYSLISGLAEPVGAVVGYVLLINIFDESLFGFVFALVAGVMVYISLDELLPTAEKYGEHHIAIYGLISGMIVMAGSLVLFI